MIRVEEALKYGGVGSVLLELLRENGGEDEWVRMSVGEVMEAVPGLTETRVKWTLKKLRLAGVIERMRLADDNAIYYRIRRSE